MSGETSGFINVGVGPLPALGGLRLAAGSGIYYRSNAGADVAALRLGGVSADDITIGETANLAFMNILSANTIIYRTTTHYFRDPTGATDFLIVDSTGVHCVAPFGGSAADNKPYQLMEATQAMGDANQTPASSVYQAPHLILTGAITANRDLVLPATTGATYFIDNQCTGAFSVNVKVTGQTGVAIANGKKAMVKLNSAHTDYVRITPDT